MYNTPYTRMTDLERARELVREVGVATVVTVDSGGVPQASLLPIVWDGGQRVTAHAARANPQFADLAPDTPVLCVVNGPDAYVNPEWYPSTADSHRAVPTWNYEAVQLRGRLTATSDPGRLHAAVRELSDAHAPHHEPRWDFEAMPEKFYDGQLRGIVGLDIEVTSVEGKAKLSGNRVEADRWAVIEGLESEDSPRARAVAAAMRRLEPRGVPGA